MDRQQALEKCIWPACDNYFLIGLSELIKEAETQIYASLDKICSEFMFVNLNANTLNYFIQRDGEWLLKAKGKKIILLSARHSEALANYWYCHGDVRGVVYIDLVNDLRKSLAYVINGRFLRKDIRKDKITRREMTVIQMTAQGMQPKLIARIENCSVKTIYTHRRNAEAKLYSKLTRMVF
ncbi:LuxR C-terminal-related transcriptional regulator [Pantoea sp. 1.19]|uniref:LuxR C-terminal-related transcriptional regulator n=1 Tax=Pantoea sp. 1.19 TaxID=1925589 RepID=UPI000948D1F4|nr:LuxR C-terminal-related transcriptional regulator [Pantoea sp. 1.19]